MAKFISNIRLSVREQQIAGALVAYGDAKEIARNVHISELTVVTHLRNIKAKLGLSRLTEVVRWWFETHYGLNAEDVKRAALAMVMLVLLIPTIINPQSDIARRGRRSRNETEFVL